jgi:Fur family ferric uptake transcriptional regulator
MAHKSADRETSLRRLLEERALRATDQRMTVLRAIASLRRPVSHAELTEQLSDAPLDRATIYRNLVALAKAGILVRTSLGDQVWRYELPRSEGADHGLHPHFVCTDCGQARCLEERTVTLHGEAARAAVTEVQLRGRCSPCARRVRGYGTSPRTRSR